MGAAPRAAAEAASSFSSLAPPPPPLSWVGVGQVHRDHVASQHRDARSPYSTYAHVHKEGKDRVGEWHFEACGGGGGDSAEFV